MRMRMMRMVLAGGVIIGEDGCNSLGKGGDEVGVGRDGISSRAKDRERIRVNVVVRVRLENVEAGPDRRRGHERTSSSSRSSREGHISSSSGGDGGGVKNGCDVAMGCCPREVQRDGGKRSGRGDTGRGGRECRVH